MIYKRDQELTSPYGDNNHPLPAMTNPDTSKEAALKELQRLGQEYDAAPDTSTEAVELLASIEDTGGCADLQFTGYGPTLRALAAERDDLLWQVKSMQAQLATARENALHEAVEACSHRAGITEEMGDMQCCVGTAKNCAADILAFKTQEGGE